MQTNYRVEQAGVGAVLAAPDDEVAREQLRAALRNGDEGVASAAARKLSQDPSAATIALLCEALDRADTVAQEATHALVVIGQPAMAPLLAALRSHNRVRRWHAAKALAAIAPLGAVPALIAALRDENASVRWEAVYGLAAIGRPSLAPLLRALSHEELSPWFATGCQRVLRRLAPLVPDLRLERLIWMLDHYQAYVAVPLEAHHLLQELRPILLRAR